MLDRPQCASAPPPPPPPRCCYAGARAQSTRGDDAAVVLDGLAGRGSPRRRVIASERPSVRQIHIGVPGPGAKQVCFPDLPGWLTRKILAGGCEQTPWSRRPGVSGAGYGQRCVRWERDSGVSPLGGSASVGAVQCLERGLGLLRLRHRGDRPTNRSVHRAIDRTHPYDGSRDVRGAPGAGTPLPISKRRSGFRSCHAVSSVPCCTPGSGRTARWWRLADFPCILVFGASWRSMDHDVAPRQGRT